MPPLPTPRALTRTRAVRTFARLVGAATALALTASPGAAQYFAADQTGRLHYGYASGWQSGGPEHHTEYAYGPGAYTASGMVGGLHATSAARIGAEGHMHARASVAWQGAMWHGTSTASAGYRDRITFVGAVPSHVEFDLFLHGRAVDRSEGMLTLWYQSFGEFGTGPLTEYQTTLDANGSHWGGTDLEQRLRRRVRADVVDGVLRFELRLSAIASVRYAGCPGNPLFDENAPVCINPLGGGGSVADFGNTAGLEGLRAYDADGRLMTGGLQAYSALGYAYALEGGTVTAASSVVPEPGTWALLGTGLAALATVAARRRGARA